MPLGAWLEHHSMKLSTQRMLDRWIGQWLCAMVSFWVWISPNKAKLGRAVRHSQPGKQTNEPVRVLVILLSEMGSVVLAKGLFDTLRERIPGVDIHVLQLRRNQSVLKLLGFVPKANLHAIDDGSLGSFVRSTWHTLRHLRRLRLNGAVDCELFSRVSTLLAYGSGATWRIGFDPYTQEGLYRGRLHNVPVPYNPYMHISQQFVGLAWACVEALAHRATQDEAGLGPTQPINRWMLPPVPTGVPVLPLEPSKQAAFEARLRHDFSVWMAQSKRVLLCVSGGALPIRAWPQAHYVALAQGLLAKGCGVGLVGLPQDTPQAQEVLAQLEGKDSLAIDMTGYTHNLEELLMLFHHAHLLVTNDGGPGHFASLTPIQTLMFFGPETSRLYGPISARATALELGLACSPCLSAYNHRDSFCDGDNQCLKRITPQTVLDLALTKLSLDSPSA
jgi:ADP-heptose:LPS heptosyltransferase